MVLLVSFFVFFTSLQFYFFSKTTLAHKTWVYPLIAAKIFIALSMGHLDIYRFIIFILNFVNHPEANPWEYSLINSMADFPYPPVLLYLQSLPFFIAQNFFDSSWFQQVLPEHYVLIRIPFLLFDSWLLWKLARSNADSKLVQIIWCSPLLIFHQFYSGQLDWVAIIPFIFFIQDFIHRSKINFCSFFFLALSLSLKPFALIFLPLMALFLIKRPQQIFWLFMAVVVYKISELPFAMTDSYKKLMGAGSVMLEASSPVFQVPLFYILYVFLMGMLWYYRKKLDLAHSLFYAMAFLTTAIPWVARFSAGWMAWIFIPMQLLYSEKLIELSDRKKISNFFWLWQFFFVLEWTFVSHSPFFDSLSVFLKTLGFETKLDMGFFYNVVSKEFSLSVAQKLEFLGHFLFGVASLIFFLLLLRSFLRFTKARLL